MIRAVSLSVCLKESALLTSRNCACFQGVWMRVKVVFTLRGSRLAECPRGGRPGCLEANLATTMGAPGPSHLGTWETTNLNRPEADHEDRDPSPINAPAASIASNRSPQADLTLRIRQDEDYELDLEFSAELSVSRNSIEIVPFMCIRHPCPGRRPLGLPSSPRQLISTDSAATPALTMLCSSHSKS